jgi:hypothetical protein
MAVSGIISIGYGTIMKGYLLYQCNAHALQFHRWLHCNKIIPRRKQMRAKALMRPKQKSFLPYIRTYV